jgi:twitching motility protein PilT
MPNWEPAKPQESVDKTAEEKRTLDSLSASVATKQPPPVPVGQPEIPRSTPDTGLPNVANGATLPKAPAKNYGDMTISRWLEKAVDLKASDAHFHTGYTPLLRINGSFQALGEKQWQEDDLRNQLMRLISKEDQEKFAQNKDLDFCTELPNCGRFRASMFLTQNGINANFRVLPPRASSLEELGLPQELARFTQFHHGLVLITGPSGCGKSTTLAALVDLINQQHSGHHILTLEDPIEIIHENKGCLVNQRQVGLHSQSNERAMRAALREDPDIVIIGEMRDAETIALALTAAETGHLVIASMHTTDAIKSITRIVDSFPPDKQSQIRTMLAESLQGVFSQLLLPTSDGQSRLVAYELLFVNTAVANLIKDKKAFQIQSIMQLGKAQGMVTLPQSLNDLVRSNRVSRDVAQKYTEEVLV